MQQSDFTLPFPPLQVRAGVLVVDGYGINLRVLYGKLRIEDGIADRRRSIVLDRVGPKLERLVIIGKTGTITLEALSWLRAIGASLVHLSSDGAVLTHSVPVGYSGHPIRRAQALAVTNGLDIEIARDLIVRKLSGQRVNLVTLRVDNLSGFDRLCEALNSTNTVDDIRVVEAQAAAIYWNAWSKVPIRFGTRDLARIPARWARYDARGSMLTSTPRAATNPVNAILNYLYSLLEAESRLALLAHGMDATLGVLHLDLQNRDSFALDVMEAVRPDVDAFVIDILRKRALTSRDLVELPNGVCRLRAPLTHELVLTLPQWRILLAPIVAHLAGAFRTALRKKNDATISLRASTKSAISMKVTHGRRAIHPAPEQSPLLATPRKTRKPHAYKNSAWRTPRVEPSPRVPVECAMCGKPVEKRRRKHCAECLPKAWRAHGLRAIERARAALAAQVREGKDPRASASAGQSRGEANAEHHRSNRKWKIEQQEAGNQPCDREWFLREITPKLDAISLTEMARATGLSTAACSRFREGTRVPHPRHWDDFITLVKGES